MQRCIQIAKKGLGKTAPNPMVGCVIVHNNKIIGEGFTSAYGGNHAEVNAINSVEDKALLKDSSLYVSLEPCSHQGKTPPCSDLIIKHNIPRVFIGVKDSNKLVDGTGISKLKASGCKVQLNILTNECREHHKRFFTYHEKKRPYIILKWAESSDGFIAPLTKSGNRPVWISNAYSRQLTHKWRSEEQAVLVGTKTVIDDNPSLSTRDFFGNNPTRIVLDKTLRLDHDYNIYNAEAKTIIISSAAAIGGIENPDFRKIKFIDWSKSNSIAKQICDILFQEQITSVIIEGGKQTLQTFIDENLWDEARRFIGNVNLKNGVEAPTFKFQINSEKQILNDKLYTYTNPTKFNDIDD